MAGFCPTCGKRLDDGNRCSCLHGPKTAEAATAMNGAAASDVAVHDAMNTAVVAHQPTGMASRVVVGAPRAALVPLPKARTLRRLLGSGIEYFAYMLTIAFCSLFGFFTGGLFGLFWVPLLLSMVGLRDLNAGAYSLGKRVGDMRVVDLRTARPASNSQALLRNSYYLVLVFLMLIPIVKFPFAGLFLMLVITDMMMVLASPSGRRIGDHLAGTQVVPIAAAGS